MKRFLRFRLRTLFVVVALVAGVLGYVMHGYRQGLRQQEAVEAIYEMQYRGNWILYDLKFASQTKSVTDWGRDKRLSTPWANYQDPIVLINFGIKHSQMEPEHFQKLLNAIRELSRLKHFEVDGEGEFVPELFNLATSTNLSSLRLSSMKLADEHLDQIAELDGLEYLSLANNEVSGSGLKSLARLTGLKRLHLGRNKITDQGIEHLAELTELETLDLSENPVSVTGLLTLKELSLLKTLSISTESISIADASKLSDLPGLEWLELRGKPIDETLRGQMEQQLPGVKVVYYEF